METLTMSTTNTDAGVPAGYMKDAQGRLVPVEIVKPADLMRDALVLELTNEAQALSAALGAFKAKVFDAIGRFTAASAAQYGITLGGRKGNITLHSFDGRFKVQVAIADNLIFDERLQAAKALIDECIDEWSAGSRPEIKVLVQDAFQTDREGRINTGRVLGLRRLDISDERWKRAMQAIGESVQVVGTKAYARFYVRVGDTDRYEPITLDIASA